jgi:hypothetical protein
MSEMVCLYCKHHKNGICSRNYSKTVIRGEEIILIPCVETSSFAHCSLWEEIPLNATNDALNMSCHLTISSDRVFQGTLTQKNTGADHKGGINENTN